jgi:hypothetical protein
VTIEFQPWPKIARLNRDIIVTEKIDGTNAAVVIVPGNDLDHIEAPEDNVWRLFEPDASRAIAFYDGYVVFAQSRTRFITPGDDNFGFAAWVKANAEALVDTLGAGTHFGEWWGSGIQRGYGLTKGEKRFSLFNVSRWEDFLFANRDAETVPGLRIVPTLYRGMYDQEEIQYAIADLATDGSFAAPGFAKPEGIVLWHEAARQLFKVTIEGDEAPKGVAGHRGDIEAVAA